VFLTVNFLTLPLYTLTGKWKVHLYSTIVTCQNQAGTK